MKKITPKKLVYLASPYNNYYAGSEAAHRDVCVIAGHLIQMGMALYCPIAHSHSIATNTGMRLHDYELWIPLDKIMMDRCDVLLIAHMPGWEKSKGIQIEVDYFDEADKPIYDLDIKTLCMVRRTNPKDPVDFNQLKMGEW
jgi:Domain of unknown function (DUF1937)